MTTAPNFRRGAEPKKREAAGGKKSREKVVERESVVHLPFCHPESRSPLMQGENSSEVKRKYRKDFGRESENSARKSRQNSLCFLDNNPCVEVK